MTWDADPIAMSKKVRAGTRMTETTDSDGITTVVRPNGETYRVDPDGWTIPESVEQARRFAEGALASATTLEENAAELREEAYRLEAEARRCRRRNTQLTGEWSL